MKNFRFLVLCILLTAALVLCAACGGDASVIKTDPFAATQTPVQSSPPAATQTPVQTQATIPVTSDEPPPQPPTPGQTSSAIYFGIHNDTMLLLTFNENSTFAFDNGTGSSQTGEYYEQNNYLMMELNIDDGVQLSAVIEYKESNVAHLFREGHDAIQMFKLYTGGNSDVDEFIATWYSNSYMLDIQKDGVATADTVNDRYNGYYTVQYGDEILIMMLADSSSTNPGERLAFQCSLTDEGLQAVDVLTHKEYSFFQN
ncbi:hypothetical protein LJB83_03215 [Clostridia bacterium OttesenSCG-928-F22]|nr:hypothetical protein [Clostridia bacterium OttesenSCG-928-F22]